ncbi:MAG: DHH family phosphoesterase [Clostridia bacterium]|nr:DHH family phosphoesterase [Clostridia bacterium]
MKKIKLKDIFVPKFRIYLVLILFILVYVCILNYKFAPIALLIYAYVLFITYLKEKNTRNRITNTLDSLIFKLKTDDTVLNFPIPAIIVSKSGEILWSNNDFDLILKGLNKQTYIENIIKELNTEYDGKTVGINKEISIHDKYYKLLGNTIDLKKKKREKETALMLYFIDRTEYYRLYRMYEDSKYCIGVVMVDNYEELVQGMLDTDRPQLTATVEKRLREWFSFTGGIMTSIDRNKYLMIFEKRYIKNFVDSKFQILNDIKEISLGNKIPVTLSIGIVVDDGTGMQKLQNTLAAVDVALGRGGDQVVLRKNGNYEFFGGNTKEVEKTTKVKPRIIAQAMKELIEESSNVLIMGHKNADADCLGAAMGVYRLTKTYKKDANIILNDYGIAIEGLCNRISADEQYHDVIITGSEAIGKIGEKTLLVVVDTHVADYVNDTEVLKKAKNVMVIDHHRRSTEAIADPILTFHEVYASSASELVTELLQYSEGKIELSKLEAECLYAGILTDTKNFMQKTGVRTFEAAAYLKKTGIDIAAINKEFQNDVNTYVAIADVIRNSEIVFDTVAIAVCPSGIENQIKITGQAADELLNLNGIETSFVLSEYEGKIYISGRSTGSLNVQVILEKFGGGGHMMMAGAQVENASLEEVKQMLIDSIREAKNK